MNFMPVINASIQPLICITQGQLRDDIHLACQNIIFLKPIQFMAIAIILDFCEFSLREYLKKHEDRLIIDLRAAKFHISNIASLMSYIKTSLLLASIVVIYLGEKAWS